MTFRGLVNGALATLFEPPCFVCHRTNPAPLDGAVCHACWASIPRLTPPLCSGCSDPLPSWRVASLAACLCARCRRRSRPITRMTALGPYEGSLRHVVHGLKYDRRCSIAPRLGVLVRDAARGVLAGADAVVPVPLHTRREWQRGFNQAELLARTLGPPVASLLTRARHTPPQVDLPAAARHRNVRDAFALRSPARPFAWSTGAFSWSAGASAPASATGLILVLVDDVTTTGATLEACARVLLEAGAREVRAVTAARVVTGRPTAPGR